MIDLILAALAGVLTIASPCVLPVLPMVLNASSDESSALRPVAIALGFVLAFSALGVAFGALSSSLAWAQDAVRTVAILILLLSGLARLWPSAFERLLAPLGGIIDRFAGVAAGITSGTGTGLAGGFVLGMTLGVVWTPCAGPTLAAILALVAKAQDLGRAGVLLALFSAGAAIPLLVIAYGGRYVTAQVRKVSRYAQRLQQVFGAAVVVTAVAMLFQVDTLVVARLSTVLPSIHLGV
ncbi:cytochrome c biogenesis CcdA family protein [Ralstonia insidiosa]|uniref:Cytochrome C biogenesis protein n=1 Tax=Ralstonia insidiosa TaxID=190721 RepID=A0A192A665_9RALS|nr:cytochrome c biogenesis CcdA family protein [Ralstonia insidiosa]ANJ75879.1 cytochrome C biogenesis protein [Ralstonia insidiosa]KAB0469317.1 cytochrome c biogenesis protein CcdA [Ralstonia insidiosa]MBY4909993.1 cytochrome c biogenesis CcdA family protein [Ralstonia insidiosa]